MLQYPKSQVTNPHHQQLRKRLAQMTERELQDVSRSNPNLFAEWCIEVYTAQRQIAVELEFETALLHRLTNCEPDRRQQAA